MSEENVTNEEAPSIEDYPHHSFPVALGLMHQMLHMPRNMEITDIRPPEEGEGEERFGAPFPPGIVMVTVAGPGVPEGMEPSDVPTVNHKPETYEWGWAK